MSRSAISSTSVAALTRSCSIGSIGGSAKKLMTVWPFRLAALFDRGLLGRGGKVDRRDP